MADLEAGKAYHHNMFLLYHIKVSTWVVCDSVVAALRTRSGRDSTEPESSSWSHWREGNPSSWYESPSESLIAQCSGGMQRLLAGNAPAVQSSQVAPGCVLLALQLYSLTSDNPVSGLPLPSHPFDSPLLTGLPNSSHRFRYLALRVSWVISKRRSSHGQRINTISPRTTVCYFITLTCIASCFGTSNQF